MPYYEISGFGKITGLKRSRKYFGETLEEALQEAYRDKMIVDIAAVKEVSGELATPRQKDFCNALGIRFPKDISKDQMAALIDTSLADPVIQSRYENLSETEEPLLANRVYNRKAPSRITEIQLADPINGASKEENSVSENT